MSEDTPRSTLPRALAVASAVVAFGGAAMGFVPAVSLYATHVLGLAIVLMAVAAWVLGRAPARPAPEGEDAFPRELALHGSSLVLLVVFLLLAMTEVLAIPAALGHLVVFSAFGLGFVTYYPVVIAVLMGALAGAVVLAARAPNPRAATPRERGFAWAALAATGLFLAASAAMGAGALAPAGLRAERAVFVLAAALVALFFFLKFWLRMPTYTEVSDWLERNERLRESGLLRKLVYSAIAIAGLGLVVAIVAAIGLLGKQVGIIGVGVAMLALLAATFNVGVSHVVPHLEMGMDNAADARRKRRIILGATSIVLTTLGAAITLLTVFAALAQVGGVEVLRFLLDAYVQSYLVIYAVVLVPVGAAVLTRTRVQTEVAYTPKLKALAIGGAAMTIVLAFFGVFIGSGLAEGSGIQIENAVLVMGSAVLALILFVKSRALLPSVASLIREAVTSSAQADKDTQETIRSRMVATYVTALVFVMGFVGYFVATTLGVAPAPSSSLGSDVGFFVYLLVGIALLVLVVMRYFQSVNIDQRFSAKKKEKDIGKKRLTAEQVKKYLILGFSIGLSVLLILVGVLITAGALTAIGPFAIEKKFATDFFVFGILVGLGPYGWYQAREARRIEAIDQKFPEFLRDLAESQRAGMTLTEAVLTAAKGSYGMLTPEIRKMAVQIEWGVSFGDALQRFSGRVNTPLISRTVSLVIQASNAGGNVVDVLTAAADDAREIQQIVKERKQSMSIYVMIIYIAFAVFVGVIAVLNAQFIPEVAKAVEKADGVSIGGLNFKAFDQEDFKTLFFHAAIIQGFGGGLVGGVMSQGKPVHGLRHSFILILIAWVLFRLVIG